MVPLNKVPFLNNVHNTLHTMPFGRTIAHHKRAVIYWLVMLLIGTACNLGRAPNTLVPVPTPVTIAHTPTQSLVFIATLLPSPTNPPPTATATPFPSLTPIS